MQAIALLSLRACLGFQSGYFGEYPSVTIMNFVVAIKDSVT